MVISPQNQGDPGANQNKGHPETWGNCEGEQKS
jgi:hypothetical protein